VLDNPRSGTPRAPPHWGGDSLTIAYANLELAPGPRGPARFSPAARASRSRCRIRRHAICMTARAPRSSPRGARFCPMADLPRTCSMAEQLGGRGGRSPAPDWPGRDHCFILSKGQRLSARSLRRPLAERGFSSRSPGPRTSSAADGSRLIGQQLKPRRCVPGCRGWPRIARARASPFACRGMALSLAPREEEKSTRRRLSAIERTARMR